MNKIKRRENLSSQSWTYSSQPWTIRKRNVITEFEIQVDWASFIISHKKVDNFNEFESSVELTKWSYAVQNPKPLYNYSSMAIFNERLSYIKVISHHFYFPLMVIFHQNCFSSKIVWNQRCLPSLILFHWRSSSIKSCLQFEMGFPLKRVFYWSIIGQFCLPCKQVSK